VKAKLSLRTLVLGLVGLGLAACQDNPGPTAGPEVAQIETTTIDGVALLNTPPGRRLTPAGLVVKIIGPEGGFIETDGGRLTIPAGALSIPVEIVEKGKEAPHYRYRFGPAGLQFAIPATLTIQIDPTEHPGVDPATLRVAGSDDLGLQWTKLGGTYDSATGTVSVPIEHFSQYALCLD
jgi:hypothetical protein